MKVQQIAELEEIVEYKKSKDNPERQAMIKSLWKKRLLGGQHNVDVWQSLLSVHKLAIPPLEELDMWLKFVGLCRKVNNYNWFHYLTFAGRKTELRTEDFRHADGER